MTLYLQTIFIFVEKNTTTKYNIQIVGINNFKPVTMMEKSYEKSRRLKISGLTCLSISLASIVSSAVASRLTRGESDLPNYAVLGVTIPVTFAMIVVGIPQMGIGVHRTRQFRDL